MYFSALNRPRRFECKYSHSCDDMYIGLSIWNWDEVTARQSRYVFTRSSTAQFRQHVFSYLSFLNGFDPLGIEISVQGFR